MARKTPKFEKKDPVQEFLLRNRWEYFIDTKVKYGKCTGEDDSRYQNIKSVKIKNIRHASIFAFFNGYFNNKNGKSSQQIDNIKSYCIYKLSHLLFIKDFNASGKPDYYGDSVVVSLNENFPIIDMLKMSDAEAIEMILIKEYGYILDRLLNRWWDISIENVSDVSMCETNLYARTNPKTIDKYVEEYSKTDNVDVSIMPTCLCEKTGDKFRLIDGRHRYIAARKANKDKIIVVYAL